MRLGEKSGVRETRLKVLMMAVLERTIAMAKPFYIEALENGDPELLKHFSGLQEFVSRDGALPAKIKTLMGMMADAILGHADGVRAIADRARAQGASEEEIAETVRMAFYFGGIPGLVTATHAFRRQA